MADRNIYDATRALFKRIYDNRNQYKNALETAQGLPEEQRFKAEEKAYQDALERHGQIIDSFARLYNPGQTAAMLKDYLADIGRNALIAMVLEAMHEPEPPDEALGRNAPGGDFENFDDFDFEYLEMEG